MKRYIWPVLFFSLFISAISCTSELTTLEVHAFPPTEVGDFTYYTCRIEQSGNKQETGSKDGVFQFSEVAPIQTTVTVWAYSDEMEMEYIAEREILLQPGSNSLELELGPNLPREKDMVLHFPSDIDAFATLVREGNGRILFQDLPIHDSRIDLSRLSYGKYKITITRIVDGKAEKTTYRFTCSEETPEELIFVADNAETETGDVTLDFFDMSSSPIKGQIRIKDLTDTITLEIEIVDKDPMLDERELEFLWFRNGTYQSSGRKISFRKTDGTMRFDCFMKSRFLGSYGSQSINISINS